MKRITLLFACMMLVLGITTAATAAPVDLLITDFMIAVDHPVPPDDTWDHHVNMILRNGVYQGSPGWTTVGSNLVASKTSGIIGAEFGADINFGVLTQATNPAWPSYTYAPPSIDLTDGVLTLGLSSWMVFQDGPVAFGETLVYQGKSSSGITTTYNASTNSWTADWKAIVPGGPFTSYGYYHLTGIPKGRWCLNHPHCSFSARGLLACWDWRGG